MAHRCVLQDSIKLEHSQLQPKFMAEPYFIHNALPVSAEQKSIIGLRINLENIKIQIEGKISHFKFS
jgi:hypothetical protein